MPEQAGAALSARPANMVQNPLDSHTQVAAAPGAPALKKRISWGSMDSKPGDEPPPLQRVHELKRNSHHALWGSAATPGGGGGYDTADAATPPATCCCIVC